MGGGPPSEAGGHHSDSRPGFGGGGGGPRPRPGDDLPDNCKLYVGNLSPDVTDNVLKTLMQPFGNVLHAVVLLDMTTGMPFLPSTLMLSSPLLMDLDQHGDVMQGRCIKHDPEDFAHGSKIMEICACELMKGCAILSHVLISGR